MAARIFTTVEFDRFARKARLTDDILVEAVDRAERGLIDADLGSNVVKLRLARTGEGRSGGFRTIVLLVVDYRAIFLLGYAKNELANIGSATLEVLRQRAGALKGASEVALDLLLEQGELREVER